MTVAVHHSDCVDWLGAHDGPLFDACVTDPPYHLTSIVKRFGKAGSAAAKHGKADNATGAYARASRGFMGKEWDGGDVAFRVETWAAVYERLKPGAHLISFSGTRTYHRMVCAIEDAGFEIRDQLAWLYGSGFPKSHKIGDGWGTALKPALEPICLARKPLSEKTVAANVLKHGPGAINIDACRVEIGAGDDSRLGGNGKWTTSVAQVGNTVSLPRGEVSSSPLGRFPANLIHDGSNEVLAGFPETQSSSNHQRNNRADADANIPFTTCPNGLRIGHGHKDTGGSAARFFYSGKAGPLDRLGSAHPTVKPVDLMRWLVRLVTPPGGLILDPFAGSGTTGIAAMAEGFGCTLLDIEADHVVDIERKLAFLRGDGATRFAEHNHARSQRMAPEALGGLFA